MNRTAILDAQLRNQLPEVAELAETLERFLAAFDVPAPAVLQINLILEELLTNTINHGYAENLPHVINVHLELRNGILSAVLDDDGMGFNPLERAPVDITASIEDREIGGLGIHLVRELADEFGYERANDRNYLRLKMNLAELDGNAPYEDTNMIEKPKPVVLAPAGRLDANSSGPFEKEMLAALDPMPAGMVMDLAQINYVSSAGLRVVLLAAKKVKAGGSKFVISGLSPDVATVFKVSGFLSILTVAPDRAAALALFD